MKKGAAPDLLAGAEVGRLDYPGGVANVAEALYGPGQGSHDFAGWVGGCVGRCIQRGKPVNARSTVARGSHCLAADPSMCARNAAANYSVLCHAMVNAAA